MIFGKKKSSKEKPRLEFTSSVRAHKPVQENVVYEDEFFEYVEVDSQVSENDEVVVSEEEIQNVPQGNFPVPPPPYFMPPPPIVPQPYMGARVPPPPFSPEFHEIIEETIIEENQAVGLQEDVAEVIEDYESGEEDGVESEDFEQLEVNAAPIASMQSEQSQELLKDGQRQEVVIKNGRIMIMFLRIFKWLFSLAIFAAMAAGCAYLVHSFFIKKPDSNNTTTTGIREAPVGNFSWDIPEGRVRSCLERFYMSIGVPQNYISANDILMRGEITLVDNVDSIYCIKKRIDDKAFIKIGAGSSSRAYLVNSLSDGVYRLVDGGMSGRRRELKSEEGWIIRSLIDFDDIIFARTFTRGYNAKTKNNFTYEGEVDVDGKMCQTIAIDVGNNSKVQYFFDNKTNQLYKTKYQNNKMVLDVVYLNYKKIDDEQLRPSDVEIYVNSKQYAKIKFESIDKRDGLIFPN